MNSQTLFFLAFAAQILIASVYMPRVIAARMRYVLENFPPSSYPRLYPESHDYYEGKHRSYILMNLVIALVGVALLAAMLLVPHEYEVDNTVALAYFLLQMLPIIWIDVSALKMLRLMREHDTRRTRTAVLNPRRWLDVMPPGLLIAMAVVYLGFWVFVAWFQQFDYPWFGGYLNNVIITAMNLFFFALMAWRMFGKAQDPHMAEKDKVRQLRTLAWVLGITSIAVTLFAVLTISLSAAEAKHFRPFAVSIYYSLLALVSLMAYRLDGVDFEVYRDQSAVT